MTYLYSPIFPFRILLPHPFHLPFADPVGRWTRSRACDSEGLQTRQIRLGAQGRRTRRTKRKKEVDTGVPAVIDFPNFDVDDDDDEEEEKKEQDEKEQDEKEQEQ